MTRVLAVYFCELDAECRLDLDHLRSLLSERTRVVAFPWASNGVGTLTPVAEVAELAWANVGAPRLDRRGALRAARDDRMSAQPRADVLICSPYKFYAGRHLGSAAFGRYVRAALRVVAAVQSASVDDFLVGHRFDDGDAGA